MSKEQLTLGTLTNLLKSIPDQNNDTFVSYDFGTALPTIFRSWRGSYDQLALGYRLAGYDGDNFEQVKLSDLVKECELANGKTYTGWKGGEYTMSLDTPVWVSNAGDSGSTALFGVKNLGYGYVVLETGYHEY